MVQFSDKGWTKKEAGLQSRKLGSFVLARLYLKYLTDIKADISRYMSLEILGEVRSRDKDLRVLNVWDVWL